MDPAMTVGSGSAGRRRLFRRRFVVAALRGGRIAIVGSLLALTAALTSCAR